MQQSDISENMCPIVYMCSALRDLSSLRLFTSDLCKFILGLIEVLFHLHTVFAIAFMSLGMKTYIVHFTIGIDFDINHGAS